LITNSSIKLKSIVLIPLSYKYTGCPFPNLTLDVTWPVAASIIGAKISSYLPSEGSLPKIIPGISGLFASYTGKVENPLG